MPGEKFDFLSEQDFEIEEPPMCRVVLLNDDYTPMDFVVGVLVSVFNKGEAEATRIMLDVHRKGRGVCGVYTREVAETKVKTVELIAEAERHPLQCEMEEQ